MSTACSYRLFFLSIGEEGERKIEPSVWKIMRRRGRSNLFTGRTEEKIAAARLNFIKFYQVFFRENLRYWITGNSARTAP